MTSEVGVVSTGETEYHLGVQRDGFLVISNYKDYGG